jgi:hypothetical protein
LKEAPNMRYIKFSLLLFILSLSVSAADTTQVKKKRFYHEIGLNSLTLLQQINAFKVPTSEQLPYDLFYNLYWKDKYGIRLGGGVSNTYTETEVQDQKAPLQTTTGSLNLRGGLSMNFASYKRVTLNAFADYLVKRAGTESVSTTTFQLTFDPIKTKTVTMSDKVNGMGGQVGVGVKFNIFKQLSLYTEVPLSYMREERVTEELIQIKGTADQINRKVFNNNRTKITLPTTIYLVLRF